jgi:predicted regulator of Ras-like GTPase activity (Roadblock/LC7/MglB family)
MLDETTRAVLATLTSDGDCQAAAVFTEDGILEGGGCPGTTDLDEVGAALAGLQCFAQRLGGALGRRAPDGVTLADALGPLLVVPGDDNRLWLLFGRPGVEPAALRATLRTALGVAKLSGTVGRGGDDHA